MSTNNGSPATKGDLQALEQRFEQRLTQLEEKIIETMRDMQTELLRGFAAHNTGLTVRMRKVEADQSNLDAATSPRLAQLEQQVTEMNIRLMKLEGR
jgi:flagellar biosynthesis/type III secretory pathway protein FliH